MTPPDRPEVLLRKAKQDELVVEKLVSDTDVEDDLIGFHAQQAAEKLLKAALSSKGIEYPRTHNLRALIEMLASGGIVLPQELSEIDRLTPFGTTFRYDELSRTSGNDRGEWISWIRRLRAFVEGLVRS